MFQPATVCYSGDFLAIIRRESADYYDGTPWPERLNPLRYEIVLGVGRASRIVINRGGKWQRHWANFNWWLWKRRWHEMFRNQNVR